MTLDVDVEADAEWDSSTDWAGLAKAAAQAAIAESPFATLCDGPRAVEIAVRLTGNDSVRALNSEWRGKDKATNVLSFPMAEAEDLAEFDGQADGPELMLGDIVLAHGVCTSEAADKALPVSAHAAHLMVHGTLHLLGLDHMEDGSAEDMEAREVRALARLGLADPYAIEEAA
jgi:probable rRNA maturation factor